MSEPAETKVPKERSPSFPIIPLNVALQRLGQFSAKFGRHPAPYKKVGLAWRIKENSSQANQILAALKSFGLIRYEGSGDKRKAVISETSRNYLRAQQDSIKKNIIRQAALKPKTINQFWQKWGADRPPDEVCLDELVFTHSFNQNAAPKFLNVYDQTIAFAGLSESDKISTGRDGNEEEEDHSEITACVGDFIQWVSQGALRFTQPKRVRSISSDERWVFVEGEETGIPMEQAKIIEKGTALQSGESIDTTAPILPLEKGWREERLLDDEGKEILIRYTGDATPKRYEFIRDYLDFKINRLKSKK